MDFCKIIIKANIKHLLGAVYIGGENEKITIYDEQHEYRWRRKITAFLTIVISQK